MYHGELIKGLDNIKLIYPAICHNMINRDIQLHWSSLMSKDGKNILYSLKTTMIIVITIDKKMNVSTMIIVITIDKKMNV